MSGHLRMIHLHSDVDADDDVTVDAYVGQTPDRAQRVVLRLFGGRGADVDTITIRLTPDLAERVAAELVERAHEARDAEEGP